MRAAAEFVRKAGGIEEARVFTRIWLALFGGWSWDDLPELPPEMILLPTWFPLNIYDFGCWARQTIVPLTVVAAYRPVAAAARSRSTSCRDRARTRRPGACRAGASWDGRFQRSTARCTATAAPAWSAARARAAGRAAGSSSARRPTAAGAASSRRGSTRSSRCTCSATRSTTRCCGPRSTGSRPFAVGRRRRAPLRGLPVAGLGHRARDDRARRRGRRARPPGAASRRRAGCSARRSRGPATGRCGGPALEPGGWAFEFAQRQLPRHRRHRRGRARAAPRRRRPGAGRAADRPRRSRWVARHAVPRTAAGAPSTPTTRERSAARAAVLRLRRGHRPAVAPTSPPTWWRCSAEEGRAGDPRTLAARRVAAAPNRRPDGSWFGRWGVNYVYGTGAVVPALVAAGRRADASGDPRAVALAARRVQNDDGGWGEDLRSYARRGVARPRRLDRLADGVGAARAAAAGEPAIDGRARAVSRWLVRDPATRRLLGRAGVHRHRLPGRLLPQLPPVPADFPDDGPRPLRPELG